MSIYVKEYDNIDLISSSRKICCYELSYDKITDTIGAQSYYTIVNSAKQFTMTPGKYLVICTVTLYNFSINSNVNIRIVRASNPSDSGVYSESSYTSGLGLTSLYSTFQIVEFMDIQSNTTFDYVPQVFVTSGSCKVADTSIQVLKF